MKSNKQRKSELTIRRAQKAEKQKKQQRDPAFHPPGTFPCDPTQLSPFNSYGLPQFVSDGYYRDQPFQCSDCHKAEVWTAVQQHWWYEIAKGYVYSHAKRCRACRRIVQEQRAASRRFQQEGLSNKQA